MESSYGIFQCRDGYFHSYTVVSRFGKRKVEYSVKVLDPSIGGFDRIEKRALVLRLRPFPFPNEGLVAIQPVTTVPHLLRYTDRIPKGEMGLKKEQHPLKEGEHILDAYVTNRDGQVFAIRNLEGMVGAVMARYSRAETGLRETLLKEFIKEDQLKHFKADKLIERVLIAYGDDSVGELEGAHVSFENISMLATKVIEHRRIGGSPIEQSTRYVRYDFKDPVKGYHYYTPPSLERAGDTVYREQMDGMFDNYSAMWKPLIDYLERCKPITEASYDLGEMGSRWDEMNTPKQRTAFKRTWNNDIKTKACDILRGFLPLATRANVGLFGNGRFFQHLISKMYTSPLEEANHLGALAFEECSKIIPHYVKRAKRSEYLTANQQAMAAVVAKYFGHLNPKENNGIRLIEPDYAFMTELLKTGDLSAETMGRADRAERNLSFTTAMVYSHARASFEDIRNTLRGLAPAVHQEIMDAYYGERRTRRDRPERGIEFGYPHNFDLVTEWAVYKDLMRHRMGTIQIQPMAPDLGFEMPPELEDAGLAKFGEDTVRRAGELYAHLATSFPDSREYAMLQGHKIRWFLGMNDRALMHMLELRTAPQGHINYRRAALQLHEQLKSRFPERMARMNFVNREDVYWSRGDSEAKIRRKEESLGLD